jgi:DNA-binding HxlR family transcriptional regulator
MPQFIHNGTVYYNPVEFALARIGGVWKMPILWRLKDRTMRNGELKKSIPNISHKMLASQLRELEADGFVLRTVYAQVPPKVEYQLTARGQAAIPVIEVLRNYGLALMEAEGLQMG